MARDVRFTLTFKFHASKPCFKTEKLHLNELWSRSDLNIDSMAILIETIVTSLSMQLLSPFLTYKIRVSHGNRHFIVI
jgi:hypothetical protein